MVNKHLERWIGKRVREQKKKHNLRSEDTAEKARFPEHDTLRRANTEVRLEGQHATPCDSDPRTSKNQIKISMTN